MEEVLQASTLSPKRLSRESFENTTSPEDSLNAVYEELRANEGPELSCKGNIAQL